MKEIIFLLLIYSGFSFSQSDSKLKTIHVYVALCDNINQGIVPVPKTLGNGQDPKNNLYWGAMYGVKSYFKRSKDWTLISIKDNDGSFVLERLLFKHKTSNTYLLADAYDGKYIKNTIIDFLEATAGRKEIVVLNGTQELEFGGSSNLLAYVGHDGLMEFDVKGNFEPLNKKKRDAIILACISKDYFKTYLQLTKANPLVWSTGLMSPEAYSLKWAIDGWILNESDKKIRERASQAYCHYQKCGIKAARNLLVTGY
ncbi:hypothetical protein Q4Q34_05485 [Flavivirga abyssicola]|uniref:hypothetical protein n=1 Tax=Flavivirga abyssicola TaxID=3063533 RepID=UPI0026E0A484|nr:hypothetical protein [Flavivirga sp. MEBiC07777]WVK14479.1 hypothetical protein Q4Q34_05485 [Flavivirga sp. MEBiC07777]